MNKMNVLFLLLFAMSVVGCNESNDGIFIDNDNMPLDPSKQYIHFDAGVSSRGALVLGNALRQSFNVLGYSYSGSWEAAKVMAEPNVFGNRIPLLVNYNSSNGIFEYSNIQPWTGKTYSFFGYYPTANVLLFDDNTTVKPNEPYITYQLASRSNPTILPDVMTASYVDTGVSSSPTVGLHFFHRLSAIDVGARNYYMHDVDGDGTAETAVTIQIDELCISFDNLVNDKAKIYLNKDIPSEYTPAAESNRNAEYYFVYTGTPDNPDKGYTIPQKIDIEPNTSTSRDLQYISKTDASTLILIPQKAALNVSGSITYQKKYKNSNKEWVYIVNDREDDPNKNTSVFYDELDITFNKELKEGQRYFIEFTFTSDVVSINIIAADEWKAYPDIPHDFD